jgi:excisionase family DNA binding protein
LTNETSPSFRERLGCTPQEACAALGIGRTLLYDLIGSGQIAVRKLGRRTVVSVPSLLALMEKVSVQPPRRGRPGKDRGAGMGS